MRISDERCEELRQVHLAGQGVAMSLDEARDTLTRLHILLARFTDWASNNLAAERNSQARESHEDRHLN